MTDRQIPALVEQRAPRSVLFVGPAAADAAEEFRARHPGTEIKLLRGDEPAAEIAALGRFDLAVVVHVLETLDKRRAENLLAALRDLHSRCLVVAVRLGGDWPQLASTWHENEMLGFGMRKLSRAEHDGRPLGIYEFNIQDYKLSPDWLNPRHWAHPELWDQHFW